MIRAARLNGVPLIVFLFLLGAPGFASGDEGAKPASRALRGVVVDEAGNPVAGAEVRGDAYELDVSRGVADSAGAFAIAAPGGPLDGRRILAISPDGRKLGRFRYGYELTKPQADAPVRIVVAPGREIAVRVADADEAPIAGATVEAVGDYVILAHATTEANGTARLIVPIDSKVSWIVAQKDGTGFDYAEFGAFNEGGSEREGAAADELPESVALTLEAPRIARIKAVGQDGEPMAGVRFHVWLLQKDGRRSVVNYFGRMHPTRTDADGIATFDWLPPSKELLVFWPLDDRYALRRVIVEKGQTAPVTTTLFRKEPIRGRVVFPDGSPANDVRVTAVGTGYGLDVGNETTRAGADGGFELRVPPNEAYAVWIRDKDWTAPARLDVVVRPGKPVDGVDFQLAKGTMIQGTVTVGNRPAASAYINLIESGVNAPEEFRQKEDRVSRQVRRQLGASTDAQGRYAIRVGPGTYTLRGPQRTEDETIEVTDQPTIVRDFHLSGPGRGPLAGRVVGPDGRALVGATVKFLSGEDMRERGFAVKTSAGGRFEAERAVHHGYIYAKSVDGSLAAFIAIGPKVADITISLAPTAEIRGTLLDETGQPAANQKLRLSARYLSKYQGEEVSGSTSDGEFTTDAEGRFAAPGLVVRQNYEVDYFVDRFRTRELGEVQAQAPGPLDLGTLRIGDRDFEERSPKVGAVAPKLAGAATQYGKPLKLGDFKGKHVLLHYLIPYSEELSPAVQDLCETFRDDDRLVILNLHYGQSAVEAWEYQLMHKPASSSVLIQGHGASHLLYGVRSFPCFILIGPDGKIIARGMSEERVQEIVARALEKPAP